MNKIRVLHPSSAWGGAHVQTCINILKGMHLAGADVHLHLIRTIVDMGDLSYSAILPKPINRLGMPRIEHFLMRQCEKQFLSKLKSDEIAWLWPGVSVETFEVVKAREIAIVMEGINTRQAYAKQILDGVYANAGLPQRHGITEAKIAEEEYLLSMATHFFSPSPGVDTALAAPGSRFTGEAMQSSYGTWVLPLDAAASKLTNEKVRVVFVGTVGIRKNAHTLLQAWKQLTPSNAELVLYGHVEDDIAMLCADILKLDSVKLMGWTNDVPSALQSCDIFVFPSYEEGDPQVTYEAAACGLPILASPMGGGRLAELTDAVTLLDPYDAEQIAQTLKEFIDSQERRLFFSKKAREAAVGFDWNAVGQERTLLLEKVLSDAPLIG